MASSRSWFIITLSIFFAAGALVSFAAAVALMFPNTPLDAMWRLNPRAHTNFISLGAVSIVLMLAVCAACLAAAIGTWRLKMWGFYVSAALLITNLIGDVYNVISGREPRAIIGIPIASVILWALIRSRKSFTSFDRTIEC